MDTEKFIKKLIKLSINIESEIDYLEDLSKNDQENNPIFKEHITNLSNYLVEENDLLDTLDEESIANIYLSLLASNIPEDRAYERCIEYLDDKIDEFNIKEDERFIKETVNQDEKYEFDDEEEADEIYEEALEFEEDLLKYYVSEDNIEKYKNYIIERNAIKAIKRIKNRILSTKADNKQETKYKKALLKNLKIFKYYFFRTNKNTELMGAMYNFNVEKIPEYIDKDINLERITYNECVTILNNLYAINTKNQSNYSVLEALYAYLCLEEHLKDLKSEKYINKLIELTSFLEETYQDSYYGDTSKKLLIRKKNN